MKNYSYLNIRHQNLPEFIKIKNRKRLYFKTSKLTKKGISYPRNVSSHLLLEGRWQNIWLECASM